MKYYFLKWIGLFYTFIKTLFIYLYIYIYFFFYFFFNLGLCSYFKNQMVTCLLFRIMGFFKFKTSKTIYKYLQIIVFMVVCYLDITILYCFCIGTVLFFMNPLAQPSLNVLMHKMKDLVYSSLNVLGGGFWEGVLIFLFVLFYY